MFHVFFCQGCLTIFFSNFLGLMAKADVSDEDAQSQETYGLLLIAVHVLMVIAILAQAYISMQVFAFLLACACFLASFLVIFFFPCCSLRGYFLCPSAAFWAMMIWLDPDDRDPKLPCGAAPPPQ